MIVFTLLLAAACGRIYPVLDNSTVRTQVQLEVKLFKDDMELNRYIKDTYNPNHVMVAGLATWYLNDPTNTCIVHIVKPTTASSEVERILGHEVLHCMYGSYHKEP